MNPVVNVVLFQAGWAACVLGAARGAHWIGPATAVAVVAFHLLRSVRPARAIALVALVTLVGALFDSALAASGWLVFAPIAVAPMLAPWWILALWALFATTLNVSLAWLRGRIALAAILGAVAGPLAYWAGERLGAVDVVMPTAAFSAIAVGWAVLLPVLVELGARLDGVRR